MALWRDGATYRDIAQQLDITGATVSSTLHRLRKAGVDLPTRKPPVWTVDEEREMLRAWDEGKPPAVVAAELGRPLAAVQRRLGAARRARGDSGNNAPWDASHDAALVAWLQPPPR